MPAPSVGSGVAGISSSQPFGLPTSRLNEGGVFEKWHSAEAAIAADRIVLDGCADNPTTCKSDTAARLLTMVERARQRTGLARFGEINRAINLSIRPVSDQAQYGAEDVWASPLMTLASGAGDCEDYAIAKFVALQLAGVPADDLRLIILRHEATQEDHAVVAARADGRWYVLDNRRLTILEDAQIANERPVFVMNNEGVSRFRDAVTAVAEIYMSQRFDQPDDKLPVMTAVADESAQPATLQSAAQ